MHTFTTLVYDVESSFNFVKKTKERNQTKRQQNGNNNNNNKVNETRTRLEKIKTKNRDFYPAPKRISILHSHHQSNGAVRWFSFYIYYYWIQSTDILVTIDSLERICIHFEHFQSYSHSVCVCMLVLVYVVLIMFHRIECLSLLGNHVLSILLLNAKKGEKNCASCQENECVVNVSSIWMIPTTTPTATATATRTEQLWQPQYRVRATNKFRNKRLWWTNSEYKRAHILHVH